MVINSGRSVSGCPYICKTLQMTRPLPARVVEYLSFPGLVADGSLQLLSHAWLMCVSSCDDGVAS